MTCSVEEIRLEIARIKQQRQEAQEHFVRKRREQEERSRLARQELHRLGNKLNLHVYTRALAQGSHKNAYALQQQALVCKTLHRNDVAMKQLELARRAQAEQVRYLKWVSSRLRLETTKMEKRLLNRLVLARNEASSMQEAYETTLQGQGKEMEALLVSAGPDENKTDFMRLVAQTKFSTTITTKKISQSTSGTIRSTTATATAPTRTKSPMRFFNRIL
eukprot:CAMPEP_0116842172 /NCGR_PEP_ID=MMETSP0418-20121206/11363_1 /TAXON_ID=1158023 /ORGANISM="Astrosyne radiata, Strain 13vi08-1A" /LENGTH=218 /DNA_ID=CAMNT_0004472741 /DNA_START=32 /DNA_END=688 /DNA_ORIENTATION=-